LRKREVGEEEKREGMLFILNEGRGDEDRGFLFR